MGAVMKQTITTPARKALVEKLWAQGMTHEAIWERAKLLPGAPLELRHIPQLAKRAKRPAWYKTEVTARSANVGKINAVWAADEDEILIKMYADGATHKQIVAALNTHAGYYRRDARSIDHRITYLGLAVPAVPDEVIPAPIMPPRVVRIYRAPEPPPSPEPWRALKKPPGGGFSMLRAR